MRGFAAVAKVLIWVMLFWMLFFQVGTMISIHNFDVAMDIKSSYETGFMGLCTGLMTLSVLLFLFLPRGKLIPMIAAAVVGICFVFIAASLHEYYGVPAGVTDAVGEYLTAWEATYRHASPLLIPMLMVPVWLVYREDQLIRMRAEETAPIESVLGGFTMKSFDD